MPKKKISPKPNEIACLYEITSALNASLDLRKTLYKVLDLLSDHLDMNRGSITLLNPDKAEIYIEVAHGISSSNGGLHKKGNSETVSSF